MEGNVRLLINNISVVYSDVIQVLKGVSLTIREGQVVSLLGEPSEANSLGVGPLSGTSATWKEDEAVISVTFVNNKVTTKSFSSSSDD